MATETTGGELIEAVHEATGLGFTRYCGVLLVHGDERFTAPVLALLYDGIASPTQAGREQLTTEQKGRLAELSAALERERECAEKKTTEAQSTQRVKHDNEQQ